MDKSEKEVDKLIHEAFSMEESEYFDQLGEQNVPQMMFGLFKGKLAWMNTLIVVIQLALFGVTIYTLTEFLGTEILNDKLEWMTYTILGFIGMALLKTWGWNQIDKNALMREIKRIEFQISLLKK
jgi:uncharacterized membrane protein